jgi:serine/threonine protein kinase
MIGKTLDHYRVGEQLGRGGMGEVYVADDLNLNRKVALKFLPEAFAADPERMARFEREAKLLASLNHPSIAAIYGLEEAEGKRFFIVRWPPKGGVRCPKGGGLNHEGCKTSNHT